MAKDFNEIPLSQSTVSHKLADIQERCAQLMQDADEDLELSLEEPGYPGDGSNPYNHG